VLFGENSDVVEAVVLAKSGVCVEGESYPIAPSIVNGGSRDHELGEAGKIVVTELLRKTGVAELLGATNVLPSESVVNDNPGRGIVVEVIAGVGLVMAVEVGSWRATRRLTDLTEESSAVVPVEVWSGGRASFGAVDALRCTAECPASLMAMVRTQGLLVP
jgi:hypothetical protein